MRTHRVLLAEGVTMLRGALVALIEREPDLRVVAALMSGKDIVRAARDHKPDVAVIDIDLPDLGGFTAAARLSSELPTCRTVILTNVTGAAMVRRAIAARVSGYLVKDAPPEQLAITIRDVTAGRGVIDMQLAMSGGGSAPSPLSRREHEVLRLAAEGAEPAEIAAALHLSVGTVRNYLTMIVCKLNARNRVDAIRNAMYAGLLP